MAETVDFGRIFGNDRPVEVEIGSGKGGFLVEAAQARPEHNFLGIEYIEQVRHVHRRPGRPARPDAMSACSASMRATCSSTGCRRPRSTCCTSTTPTPGPRNATTSGRLFQPAFVEAAIRTLKPGGLWYIQTDHAEYFEVMKAVTLDRPQLEPIDFAGQEAAAESAGPADELRRPVRPGRRVDLPAGVPQEGSGWWLVAGD